MNIGKNLRIRTKLTFAFLTLSIIAGVIGTIAMLNIDKVSDNGNNMYEKQTVPLGYLSEIVEKFPQIRIEIRNAILSNSQEQALKAKNSLNQKNQQVDSLLKIFKDKESEDVKVIALLSNIESNKLEFMRFANSVADIAISGDKVAALEQMQSQSAQIPTMNIVNLLDELKKIEIARAKASAEDNDAIASSSAYTMLGFTIFGMVAALFFSYILSKMIVKPLESAVNAANKIANGDLNINVDTDSKDETGVLLVAIKKMSNSIQNLIVDVNQLTVAASDGKLDVRANSEKHQGAYGEIVLGINGTLDAVIRPLNVAAEYIDRISKGDIPPKITDDYKGDFNEMKQNLNQCIDSLSLMNQILQQNIDDQVAGEIFARAESSQLQGVYKKLVDGVNETMDVIHGAVAKGLFVMDKYAEGDLSVIMEDLPGKQMVLTNALHNIRKNILELINDANLLSDAAIEGKLDVRADASRHKGDYQRIISGFNNTLDSVIRPLNIAAEYIDRIAKGDIPPKITDNYKGDFNGIKNNLNMCIDNLNGLISEMLNTTNEQKAGDIEAMAHSAKFGGIYKELIEGFNLGMQIHIDNILFILNLLNEYAEGDLTNLMPVLPGKQIIATNRVNKLRQNVIELVEDTNLLATAAMEGKLDVRADATKLKGDFRNIIEGFNGTLDSVIRPLNIAAEYIDRIAKGDIPPKITDNYYGDFNGIKNNLNMCIDNLNGLIAEMLNTTNEQKSGDIEAMADSAKFGGIYKELINGFNLGMQIHIDNILYILNLLNEYAEGNLANLMPVLPGKQIIATNRVNKLRQNVIELVEDSKLLAEAAIDGKLDVRADATKHYGEFRRIIEGFNGTLDAVIRPLNVAAEYIDRISKGDIPQLISDHYKGDFNDIINNLNLLISVNQRISNAAKAISEGDLNIELHARSADDVLIVSFINMISNLKEMIHQINSLSESALSGKLDTRADATKHKGDFRKIIQGVNDTLDAIIHPLNVSAEYMDRIAKGDIPVRITEEYRGDFNEIKNNLNLCIDSINLLINDADNLARAAINGDTKKRADIGRHNGDYKKIIIGFNNTLDAITAPIEETVTILEQMAQGNFSNLMEGDFAGDHAILKQALNSSLISINELLNQVNNTVDRVMHGSAQVAEFSQNLSSGSTEQAASIEEMSASMMEIATQTKQNADNAINANKLADSSQKSSERGHSEMEQLQAAMIEINESSKNIAKIIKVIDEIAFQTNLLALNAAVEAARAGVHGQGFAVVAEEVRNLAARSAQAAKETAELIEGSIKTVENGTHLSEKTATVLDEIRVQSTNVADLIKEIAVASNEQATGIKQMEIGFSQVDSITQRNTAGAEQSAVAADELAEQAQLLRKMLNSFVLMNYGTANNIFSQNIQRKALNPINSRAIASGGLIMENSNEYREESLLKSSPKDKLEFARY